jgi:malate/lactate dehydrogenase
MAYAAALFADACLRGMNGATATECTYVESEVTDLPFFATKVKLGTEGEPRSWRVPITSCFLLLASSMHELMGLVLHQTAAVSVTAHDERKVAVDARSGAQCRGSARSAQLARIQQKAVHVVLTAALLPVVVRASCFCTLRCESFAGVETIHPIGSMSDYEKEAFAAMKPELAASIEKGFKFVRDN